MAGASASISARIGSRAMSAPMSVSRRAMASRGPALALGELVHDAGHRALRVDADQRSRGVERDDRVLRGELFLERLPGAGIAQVAERADGEDLPADATGMDVAARGDIEAEAERGRVQPLRGLAAHGVVERVPLLHQVRQLARRR